MKKIFWALTEEVTARNITDTKVIFTPGRRFKEMRDTIEFQKAAASNLPGHRKI